MAEKTHYAIERSKSPMPEWETIGTNQTFQQALAAVQSWHKDSAKDLRIVRVRREVIDEFSAEPALEKHQPCGCVICTCEDEEQCHGCGARFCDAHNPRGVSRLEDHPETP